MENYIFRSEMGSRFGELGSIPPPRIQRSTPGGDSNRICQEPKARAMQEIRNPESLKYFRQWYLESWKFCLWNSDPGLWNPECSSRISGMPLTIGIGDPRRGIQNPGLSWIPLHGVTRRCSHPRYPRNWNSLMTLFIWAALLTIKMALKSRRSQ